MHECMYVWMDGWINGSACMCVCVYARTHACMHVCMYVCMYVYDDYMSKAPLLLIVPGWGTNHWILRTV